MLSLNHKIRPCPELAKYINCYYVFDDGGIFRELEVTTLENGITEMIIHLGDPTIFCNKSRNIRNQYRVSLTGQYLDDVVMVTTGHTHIISVNFKPGGMYAIFGVPQNFYESKNVSLDDIESNISSLLWEELMEQQGIAGRIHILEEFLIQHVRRSRMPVTEMSRMAEYIRAFEGQISVHLLAGMAGMSVRTFSRRFSSQIGLSPKQYAEIIRLNRVCSDMVNTGKHDLLTIALHHGYYDASHLINTFKKYLHLTPSEFTIQLLKDGDYTGKFTLIDPATDK